MNTEPEKSPRSTGFKIVIFAFILFLLMLLYVLMGGKNFIMSTWGNTCDECGKHFWGSGYYDYTETMTFCEDCARTYWMPLPYQNYKK